jgi:hypothetical protein
MALQGVTQTFHLIAYSISEKVGRDNIAKSFGVVTIFKLEDRRVIALENAALEKRLSPQAIMVDFGLLMLVLRSAHDAGDGSRHRHCNVPKRRCCMSRQCFLLAIPGRQDRARSTSGLSPTLDVPTPTSAS